MTKLDTIEISLQELAEICDISPKAAYELRNVFVRGSARDRFRAGPSVTAYLRHLLLRRVG